MVMGSNNTLGNGVSGGDTYKSYSDSITPDTFAEEWTTTTAGTGGSWSEGYENGGVQVSASVSGYFKYRWRKIITSEDIRKDGNTHFFFSASIKVDAEYRTNGSSKISLDLDGDDTTLIEVTATGGTTDTAAGANFWITIIGDNLNIRRQELNKQGTGSYTLISNDTDIDISAIDEVKLYLYAYTNAGQTYNSAFSYPKISPIIGTKKIMGSRGNKVEW